jgi:hypothetical protein
MSAIVSAIEAHTMRMHTHAVSAKALPLQLSCESFWFQSTVSLCVLWCPLLTLRACLPFSLLCVLLLCLAAAYGHVAVTLKGSKGFNNLIQYYMKEFERQEQQQNVGSLDEEDKAELTVLLEQLKMTQYLKGLLKQNATVEFLAGELSGVDLSGVALAANVPMRELLQIVKAAKVAKAPADDDAEGATALSEDIDGEAPNS